MEERILERCSESTDTKEFSDMLKVHCKFRSHLSLTHYIVAELHYKLPHAICHRETKMDKPERVFFFFFFTYSGCSNLSIRSTFSTRSPPIVRTKS